jgi:protocatechuate 3,4-dioxygenase beta subunit
VRPRPLDVDRWLRVERTGDDGVARFLRLPPGALNALTNRGASADVELTAGSTANATIALPRTLDVRGRVVDLDGRPFAGATVWMSIWRNSDDGEPVAISGADGSFLIRDAGPWHLLAATAPGFATANVQSVRQPDVVLSMRPAAGTIVGTVVDPHGRPVAGARVLLGVTFGANLNERGVHTREFWGLDGRDMWPSRYLRTDDDGHFRSEGLPPGVRWPLWVGAQQFAPAFCEVDVRADAETAVTVQLVRGATLHGRIADAAGAGIAGARVWAYCELPEPHPLLGPQLSGSAPPAWAKLSTKTDANGCYELTRVRPAQYTLRAWHRFAGAAETDDFSATATHEFADGETFEWNAVVEPKTNQPLHGVLVDEVGNPLERWVVRVEEDPYNPDGIDVGAGGSFRTYRVPPGRRRISVRPREPMFGAAFDAGEFDVASCPLRIVVPRAFVPTSRLRGRVVPPAGIAASSTGRWLVRVMPADPRYLLQLRCDADGKYEAGPLERGRYRLTVVSRVFGEAPMGAIEVVDGRDTDAGTFQPPVPGTLVVTVVDPQGKRRPDAWVTAQLVGRDEHLAPARDPRASNHLDHRDGVARGNVVPGRWRVATRDFAVMAAIEVDVRAGETTDVRFAVPDGVPFVLRVPAAARARGRMAVRWLGADGTLLREHILYEDDVGRDEPMLAAAGRYTLEVIDWRGTKTSATFDLRASDPPQVVELPLQ